MKLLEQRASAGHMVTRGVAHTHEAAPFSGKHWVILMTQKTKRQTEATLKTPHTHTHTQKKMLEDLFYSYLTDQTKAEGLYQVFGGFPRTE